MAAASRGKLERAIDELYQLPLSEFVPARDALAKSLRAEDRREEAERVKTLRKPTVAVWLANRLAVEDEVEVQRLLKAGETLTKTQAQVAAGSAPDEFLKARRSEQQALERLAREAQKIAGREGIGESAVERATQTLRAASLSEEGRELLRRGRLSEELSPPGFEALTGMTFAAPHRASAKESKADPKGSRRAEIQEARERLRALRAEARELSTAARAARREADRAEKEASRLRERADEAEAEASEGQARVAEAEAELEGLR